MEITFAYLPIDFVRSKSVGMTVVLLEGYSKLLALIVTFSWFSPSINAILPNLTVIVLVNRKTNLHQR